MPIWYIGPLSPWRYMNNPLTQGNRPTCLFCFSFQPLLSCTPCSSHLGLLPVVDVTLTWNDGLPSPEIMTPHLFAWWTSTWIPKWNTCINPFFSSDTLFTQLNWSFLPFSSSTMDPLINVLLLRHSHWVYFFFPNGDIPLREDIFLIILLL